MLFAYAKSARKIYFVWLYLIWCVETFSPIPASESTKFYNFNMLVLLRWKFKIRIDMRKKTCIIMWRQNKNINYIGFVEFVRLLVMWFFIVSCNWQIWWTRNDIAKAQSCSMFLWCTKFLCKFHTNIKV